MTAPSTIRGISSMATRQVLAELVQLFTARTGVAVDLVSVGGVDAAQRVQAGEPFDVVFLAADAMAQLEAAGHLLPGSVVPLVHSGVAVAVPAGAPVPDLSDGAAVRAAVAAAASVSVSTGPSGVALNRQFQAWGLAETLKGRLVTPPPGVPVGSLVARGAVALGFQQLSELIHVQGITLAGPLPPDIQITTTFSGGVARTTPVPEAVRTLLAFMASPDAVPAKRRQGMDPA